MEATALIQKLAIQALKGFGQEIFKDITEVAKEGVKTAYKELKKEVLNDKKVLENLNLAIESGQSFEKLRQNSENQLRLPKESSSVDRSKEVKGDQEEIRAKIAEISPYSSEINKFIKSVEELQVYIDAGLKESEINGRKVLLKDDIDPKFVDEKTGETNRERMEKGRCPLDSETGEKIELHHIGQTPESPLAELLENQEHGKYTKELHLNNNESWRRNPELNNHYNNIEKPEHWKARAEGIRA